MPSGRDSFRRNRVAPSVQLYFNTVAECLGIWVTLTWKMGLETRQILAVLAEALVFGF